MKIYIDFDDVICETAKNFSKLAREMFQIERPYEEICYFDLRKAFELSEEQYDRLMEEGHKREVLLSYEETPGASETIQKWFNEGHDVRIITGRPFSAYEPSRKWLDDHGLSRIPLYCVDKYGRGNAAQKCDFGLSLNELYQMTFDLVVEDSPNAFEHILHLGNCTTAVFDRPWNRFAAFPNERFIRCSGWAEIDGLKQKVQNHSASSTKKS